MSNRTHMDFDGQGPAVSRIGLGFTAGVLVGLAGAMAGLVLAVAARKRTRDEAQAHDSADLHAQDLQAQQDDELDEELAQTFPASDPLPQSHRVD